MRILAIDPAIRNTGYAVIEGDASFQTALDYGVISIPQRIPQSEALAAVSRGLSNLIKKWEPDEVAVEAIIFVQSHKTAISMGAARAAALIAGAEAGLPIFEYAPTKVKNAVVGRGQASKQQVAYMTRALLKLQETPSSDAADALAIAIAHLSSMDPLRAKLLEKKQI
jgi:crossover junction endodeoxyribonuclease RuvC